MYTKLRYPKILHFLRQNEKLLFPDFYLTPTECCSKEGGTEKRGKKSVLMSFPKPFGKIHIESHYL